MIILYHYEQSKHEHYLYDGLRRTIEHEKLDHPGYTVLPSAFVTPSKNLSWIVAGWLTQLLTLTIGTSLIIFSGYREICILTDLYDNERKKFDDQGSIGDFFKKNKQFLFKLVKELLQLAVMLVALQFEIDNFIDYTNGEALLFEPVFIVEAILCLLIIVRLTIMTWKSYKISYKLIVIDDPFPVEMRVEIKIFRGVIFNRMIIYCSIPYSCLT